MLFTHKLFAILDYKAKIQQMLYEVCTGIELSWAERGEWGTEMWQILMNFIEHHSEGVKWKGY